MVDCKIVEKSIIISRQWQDHVAHKISSAITFRNDRDSLCKNDPAIRHTLKPGIRLLVMMTTGTANGGANRPLVE